MAAVFLAPTFGAGYQSFLANGQPNNGGFISTYVAGSTTPQATFTTSAGNVANGNPIPLGADGRPPQEIWLSQGAAYKFVVTDAFGNILGTYDNLSGINDTTATTPSEWLAWTGAPTFVSTTTFTLAGNVTGTFTQNMRVKTINTGGTVYGSIISATYNVGPANTTIVILPDSGGVLDNGISAVYYSLLNPAHTSIGLPPTGTQVTIAPNTAPFFEGSQVNLTSGDAYVLNGNKTIKKAWLSNVGIDTLGNFSTAMVTGKSTVLFWGSDDVWRAYTATATAGVKPVFNTTPTYTLDLTQGINVGGIGTSRRNTVLIGPTDISGFPSLLPQTVTGLALSTQNVVAVETVNTATVTFTAATPGVVNWTGHTLVANQAISFTNSGGALPAALTAGTTYYVLSPVANAFNVSATPGGAAIAFATAGTGTQTCWAGVQNVLSLTAFWGNDGTTGELNNFGAASANLNFGTLPNASTVYLYCTVPSNGILTPAFTTLAPVVVDGSTTVPSITNGQITINTVLGETYLGNGSAAVETPLVVIGTATTSGGNITATTTYNYGKPPTSAIRRTGTLLNRTLYNTAGTFQWIRSALATSVNVKIKGGGGQGGNANGNAANFFSSGAGGGEGGYSEYLFINPPLTATITLAAGGTSSFGSLMSATAGAAGAAGTSGASSVQGAYGGVGGNGVGGEINLAGQSGASTYCASAASGCYPAGGLGGGSGGGYGAPGQAGTTAVNGVTGQNGAGGGGAAPGSGNSLGTGGAASVGYIIVEEYA